MFVSSKLSMRWEVLLIYWATTIVPIMPAPRSVPTPLPTASRSAPTFSSTPTHRSIPVQSIFSLLRKDSSAARSLSQASSTSVSPWIGDRQGRKAAVHRVRFFWGFSSRPLDIVRKAFITYIRPIFDFSSITYGILLTNILLTSLKMFTKRVTSLKNYTVRLQWTTSHSDAW
jgi:hypothetical protein